MFILGQ